MNGQLHAPAALPRRKELRYPQNMKLGGHHRRVGRFGDKNPLLQPGLELRTVEPVAQLQYRPII